MIQSCENCLNLALSLKDGLCQPCRLRAGETIAGHRLVVADELPPPDATAESQSEDATDANQPAADGDAVVQLTLG